MEKQQNENMQKYQFKYSWLSWANIFQMLIFKVSRKGLPNLKIGATWSYLSTPPLGLAMTQGQFLSGV